MCWSSNSSYTYVATKNQKKYLMKFISMTQENIRKVDFENQLQSEIQHPYIMPILEQFNYEKYRVLVMPYTPSETLIELQRIPDLSIRFISISMYRIAVALSTLHSNNILLRNIKPLDIFIDDIESEEPKPQINNFENSVKLVDNDSISFSSDVLSYGFTFLFLIHNNIEKMFEQYPDLKDLIQKTLETDPKKRINTFEITEHPFFVNVLGKDWIQYENESLYSRIRPLFYVEEAEEYDDLIGI
ncbi:AGC family protein kinase [Histomonas meleagridis]|uniref:AGC family protein kinase n=1 Tax=Histomonas meleagridis TaxID=135588 RepID=UPI00355A62A0|nr:AGC family protein kinase [Histomonas meleagridis]KAH0802831.1 AGC family protein kinase [Histomonas meleagridis]